MSDRITWALPPDFRVRLTALLPGVTEADFARLGSMICADTTLGDDGTAHPAFIAWVADVLRRRGGGAALELIQGGEPARTEARPWGAVRTLPVG